MFLTIIFIVFSFITSEYHKITDQGDTIINAYSNEQFISFESEENIYIIQFNTESIAVYKDFITSSHIRAVSDNFILTNGNNHYTFSISPATDDEIQIVGLILLEKKPRNINILGDFIESLTSNIKTNCWSGGEGATRCNVGYRNAKITVRCKSAHYPCCNRDLTGFCVKG